MRKSSAAAAWSTGVTTAGKSTEAETPAPAVPVQATAAAPRKVATTRQTLDLPAEQYDQLHDEVRRFARENGFTSRDFNAQRVLRALVARVLTDDQADLRRQVFDDVRQQVRSS